MILFLQFQKKKLLNIFVDILISRAFSFDLKDNLSKSQNESQKNKKQEHFLYAKDEVKPGYWAAHLKSELNFLGNKIMDRYSNISLSNSIYGK